MKAKHTIFLHTAIPCFIENLVRIKQLEVQLVNQSHTQFRASSTAASFQ